MKSIKKSKYEGYIWYSDATSPIVYRGNDDIGFDLDDDDNPFIIEGQLWDGKNSIGIKYVDGRYIVSRYEIDDVDHDVETYIAHRMEGVSGLKFKRLWRERPDVFCENFEVLEPAGLVFVGFKK